MQTDTASLETVYKRAVRASVVEPELPFLAGAGAALFGWSRSPFWLEPELPFLAKAGAVKKGAVPAPALHLKIQL